MGFELTMLSVVENGVATTYTTKTSVKSMCYISTQFYMYTV